MALSKKEYRHQYYLKNREKELLYAKSFARSPKGKEYQRKWHQSLKRKLWEKDYRQTPKRKAYTQKYTKSFDQTLEGKVYKKEYDKKYRQTPGGKMIKKRIQAKRKRALGYEIINEPFKNSCGHHIDKTHVIFIPKELHKSIWHSQSKPNTMEQINTLTYLWVLIGNRNGDKVIKSR